MVVEHLVAVSTGLLSIVVPAQVRAGSEVATARVPVIVSVRVYNRALVPTGHVQRARDIAQSIVREVGVEVVWAPGSTVDNSPDTPCRRPAAPNDLMVRIVKAPVLPPPWAIDNRVLGRAYVDAASRTGALALILWDNIDATAKRLNVDAALLMGRVMAHELGHLIGMRQHSTTGLMRKYWSDDSLRRGRDLDFQFGRHIPVSPDDDATIAIHGLAP